MRRVSDALINQRAIRQLMILRPGDGIEPVLSALGIVWIAAPPGLLDS